MSWYWWITIIITLSFYTYVKGHKHGRLQGLAVGMEKGFELGTTIDETYEEALTEESNAEHTGKEARDILPAE